MANQNQSQSRLNYGNIFSLHCKSVILRRFQIEIEPRSTRRSQRQTRRRPSDRLFFASISAASACSAVRSDFEIKELTRKIKNVELWGSALGAIEILGAFDFSIFDGIHIIDIGLGRFILAALPSFRYALERRFFSGSLRRRCRERRSGLARSAGIAQRQSATLVRWRSWVQSPVPAYCKESEHRGFVEQLIWRLRTWPRPYLNAKSRT